MQNTIKKYVSKTVAILALSTVVSPLFTVQSLTAYACDSVEACQTQLEQLQTQNQIAQQNLSQSQTNLMSTQNRIEETQSLLNNMQTEIDLYQTTIDNLTTQIAGLETQITELEAAIAEKEAILRARLVDMQMRTKTNQFLDFIVNSESLGDLLSRIESINQLTAYDNELMNQIQADKATIEAHKATIEANKAETEQLKADAEGRKTEYASLLQSLQADRQALAKTVLASQGDVDSLNLSEADIQAQLEILKNYVPAPVVTPEPTPAPETTPTPEVAPETTPTPEPTPTPTPEPEVPQSGGFYRPTSGVVTLEYMSTEYPYSASRPHLGTDIGAATGTPVVALTDGVVIQASYGDNGGYGNMIVISHVVNGNPMVSIYGHLSSISVSAGQSVSGGQNIGAVGNTGNSFGAHLHIEVLSGINYMPAGREERQQYTVNPQNYF